jgi:hypothetical protein
MARKTSQCCRLRHAAPARPPLAAAQTRRRRPRTIRESLRTRRAPRPEPAWELIRRVRQARWRRTRSWPRRCCCSPRLFPGRSPAHPRRRASEQEMRETWYPSKPRRQGSTRRQSTTRRQERRPQPQTRPRMGMGTGVERRHPRRPDQMSRAQRARPHPRMRRSTAGLCWRTPLRPSDRPGLTPRRGILGRGQWIPGRA